MTILDTSTYSPMTRVLFNHIVVTENGCWEWQGAKRKGYGRFTIAGKNYSVHRIIFEDLVGPIPEGMVVMHAVCDNPPCCRPDHLRAGTQAENLVDMHSKGRAHKAVRKPRKVTKPLKLSTQQREPVGQAYGSRHGNSKLSEASVKEIRELYMSGINQAELSRRYGVDQSNISRAVHGKLWSHVTS